MTQGPIPPENSEDHNPLEPGRGAPSQSFSGPVRIPVKLPQSSPAVTYTLIAVTVGVFLLQIGSQNFLGVDWPGRLGMKVNSLIAQGQFWRLLTPLLLHGSILHVGFNMYAFYILGPRLERFYGHWRFLALYLLSGFGGNVFSMMFTDAPSLGASTATFGLLAAQGVFFYQNRQILGAAARQAMNGIISVAAINLIIGLSPGIDNWGHLGGIIGGIAFAWLGGPILAVTGVYPAMSLTDQRRSTEVLQAMGIVAVFFGILTAGTLYLR